MTAKTYRMLDYGFRVASEDARAGRLLDDLLRPFRQEGKNGLPTYSLTRSRGGATLRAAVNGRRVHEAASVGALVSQVLWWVNAEAIKRTRSHILVHAGAVSWRRKGVVLPAAPESGKTTVVAGLVRAGFGYLSDEAAAIDPATGWLHPYPKPLSMRRASIEALEGLAETISPDHGWGTRFRYEISPDDLRRRAIGKPCPIRFVVAPNYDPDGETRLVPLSRAEALTIMVEQTLNLPRWRSRGVVLLGTILARAECYRLSVGRLEDAVGAVEALAQGHAGEAGSSSDGK